MIDVLYEGPDGWGEKAYPGDAGIDLPITEEKLLGPGEFADMPSGIKIAVPEGYYGRIVARSSALRKRQIRVYEGIIDSGFRGELFTYMENVGKVATKVKPGERLAQLIIQPVIQSTMRQIEYLPQSVRGTRGFGSSDTPEKRQPHVYLGGPIDYKDGAIRDSLITRLAQRYPQVVWFDPKEENAEEHDPAAIWTTNSGALERVDIGVFLFDDPSTGYGFGSPIEIASLVAKRKPVIVYHNSDNVGVYLRKLWQDGVVVALDWKDFERCLGEELAKVAHA